MEWAQLAQDWVLYQAFVITVMTFRVPQRQEISVPAKYEVNIRKISGSPCG
jgi:hypothetical protein